MRTKPDLITVLIAASLAALITFFAVIAVLFTSILLQPEVEVVEECAYNRIMALNGDKDKLRELSNYCKLPLVVEKYIESPNLYPNSF